MRFLVAETKNGSILDELPLRIDGPLSRALQGYGTGSFSLPTTDSACPVEWEQRTIKNRNTILVVDDTDQENILWSGIISNRKRSISPLVQLTAATSEAYLLRRFVPDLSFKQVDQALIMRRLAQLAGDTAGILLDYDTPLTGVIQDKDYKNDENATVYQRLQERSNLIKGAAWTIDVEWANDAHTSIRRVFRTGYPMLGNQDPNPEHIFDLPGSITETIEFEERGGEGDEATHVTAIGDGEGEAKLYSTPVIDSLREQNGWPRTEARSTFSGVTETPTINSHASSEAAAMFGGQTVLSFDSRIGIGPDPALVTLGDTSRAIIDLPHLAIDDVFNLISYSIDYNAQTWKPTLGKIGVLNAES